MSRSARLLQLLERLRSRRQPVAGAKLAQDLGVSLRTLYRDIDTLRQQGAHIEGDAGVGYVLKPGFMLPPLMFSADELEALALGMRWVALQADQELAGAAASAMARIGSSLPPELLLNVQTSGLLVPEPDCAQAPEPWLPNLRQAIRREHKVCMDYRDVNGASTQRTVWPFAMAFFQFSRVLVAWCELRGDFRHFRADRVLTLTDTGTRYPERRHNLISRWQKQMDYDMD